MTLLTLLITTIITMSILFTLVSHPLALGLTLIVQTILICLITSLLTPSPWFSYILFLIYMGAMLVLFIYISALACNEFFKFSWFFFIGALLFVPLSCIAYTFLSSDLHLPVPVYSEGTFLDLPQIPVTTQTHISQVYGPSSSGLTSFIILYLLLTLMVVVKITSSSKTPLRISKP